MNNSSVSLSDIEQWLTLKIAITLHQRPDQVNQTQPLVNFGFDSLHLQTFFAEIEDTFLITMDTNLVLLNENIRELSQNILSCIIEQNVNPTIEKSSPKIPGKEPVMTEDPSRFINFEKFSPYQNLKKMKQDLGEDIFFDRQEGISTNTCVIGDKKYLNFTSFNYLGLNNHPAVLKACINATKKYGTSVSASRLVSGEKIIHQELERAIASLLGVDDAIVLHSGHSTNITTIAHLFGHEDLILHDELAHNSLVLGAVYSKATRVVFPHNDWNALDNILKRERHFYKRVLIIIEGIYSMDGDISNLPQFIRIKNKYSAWLMVDEAHSIGVLGDNGAGISKHFHINPCDVEIWMGTISKAFASNGGYIAGQRALIEYLKYTSPASIFSTGISPSNVAAALTAIQIMRDEPDRLVTLRELSSFARETALQYEFNIGLNECTPILPIIIGDSKKSFILSRQCMENGVNVKPIIYPAVPEHLARLRFFITVAHKPSQIKKAFALLSKINRKLS